jgi:lipoate-protein ligase A
VSFELRCVTAAEEQAWNDRQLAAPVRAPTVALWTYPAPAVVLGRSQYKGVAVGRERHGLPIVHRRTGGGAVLVGPGVLGVSVLLPPSHPLISAGLVPAYEWLGRAHARALQRLGVACEVVSPEVARGTAPEPTVAWACFGALSPWEVVTRPGRRKLVGLAQRRSRDGVLMVCGTLVEDAPWDTLCHALGHSAEAAAVLQRVTSSCEHEIGNRIAISAVAREIAQEFAVALRL